MKKMVKWFTQLQAHKVEPTLPELDEEESEA
jgi:hypothetical protein